MFNIKRLVCLILLAFVFIGITGCKKDDGAIQSGELVVVEDTKDIKLGIYNIDTLNPILTRSGSVQEIMNIVYEPLFSINEKRELENVLAAGYTLSDDGRQITVSLKNNIKWSDGTKFTAKDVIYTLSQIKSENGFYQKAKTNILSFVATNSYQVIIDFENPEPNLAYYLTFPIIKDGSANGEEFVPIGTGAYAFSSKNGTEIILFPNNLWWGKDISKKKIIVKILKDKAAQKEAFRVGEIDAFTSDEVGEELAISKGNSALVSTLTDKMVFVGFNTKSTALSSEYTRRALVNLIDKKKILENNAYGHGKVADICVNPDSWAHQTREVKADAKDTAKKLIEGEGYALSDGVYYKNEQPLTLKILVNVDNLSREAIAESVAGMLKSAGISVEIDKVSYEEYLSKIDRQAFDIFIGEITVEPNLNPMTMLKSNDNYFNFDTSELFEVYSELLGSVGKEEYKKVLQKFVTVFYKNPPYLPLYFKSESVIYANYVSGQDVPMENNLYRGIQKWYYYDKNENQEGNSEEISDE